MASGEAPSPLKGPKLSASSNSSRNDCDEMQWMVLPNNLEISSRSKPSKKQRNKDKLKSFPQENIASNVTERLSSSPVSFQNFSRIKCNTASWLQDQLANDKKIRKRTCDPEETFSDTDLALSRGAMNFPVNHTVDTPEHSEELQRPPSRRGIIEKENTKSNKDDCKRNEVQENGAYAMNGISSAGSKASICASNISFIDASNGGMIFHNEEEHSNKCNHILEKMKQSEERLLTLKMQESLLYNMQKKDENKLSSFPARDQIHPSVDDQDLTNDECFWNDESTSEQRQWTANKTLPLQEDVFDEEDKQLSYLQEPKEFKQLHMSLERLRKRVQSMHQSPDVKNMARSLSSDDSEIGQRVAAVEFERKKLKNKLVELQEKKKMNDELLQELSYLKDVTAPLDAAKKDDSGNFAVTTFKSSECVRSNDKKRVVHTLRDADRKLSKLETTLHELDNMMRVLTPQESLQNDSTASEATEMAGAKLDSRNMRTSMSNKRDNVRKEINGFPARRHYEAEGRANEDVDVPQAAAPSQPSITSKWSPTIQQKLRKIQEAQKYIQVINSVMSSIQEAQRSGRPLSVEHQNFLSSLPSENSMESEKDQSSSDSEEFDYESETLDNNPCENISTVGKEICSDTDKGPLQLVKMKVSERKKDMELMSGVLSSLQEFKNSGRAIPMKHLQVLVDLHKDQNKDSDCESDSDVDSDAVEHSIDSPAIQMNEVTGCELTDILPDGANNTDFQPDRKKDFLAFVSDYNRYMSMPTTERNKRPASQLKDLPPFQSQLPSFLQIPSECRNEDVRSSGEGGYVMKRNSESSRNSVDHVQPVHPLRHHQDNFLLTRQNIATMESQNQSCSRNLRSRSQNSKKDKINNLSGKTEKRSIQNSVNGPFCHADGPKDNLDSVSTLSSELNQSRSGETERKTILDILKHGRKKQVYDRNRETRVRSNSSADSEPLECSNSALAVGTTVAATWGGSSTQENFDDENEEPSELMQRQHHVDGASGNNYRPVPKSRKGPKMGPLREATSGASVELPNSAPCSSDAVKDYQQQISTHFIQQLKRQINQLNALCQEELLCEGPQTSPNFHQNCNPGLLTPCQSLHAVPDIIHPYNQQLLLCLSQSYHTLYMQQMEIQHLHHYIRHHIDSEVIRQTSAVSSQGNNSEEFEFRPWCMSACSNPLMPSNMYSNDQVSPKSSTYVPLPMKSFPSHGAPVPNNRPVRAVIHPASQENRTAQETLNNQVPPRTRANNFWDNFRSYSRQNLLSTANTAKRNENIGLPVAPQVRQVHPMVSNGNINNLPEMGNSCSSLPSDFSRHSPASSIQDLLTSSKKPNISAPTKAQCRYTGIHKKESVGNVNSSLRNLLSGEHQSIESSHPNPCSVNLIQLHPNQDLSKVGNFSPICPTSATESLASHATADPSNAPQGDFEYPSDFLMGLYQEAKALKSYDQRQQALKMIRDLAKNEMATENDHTSTRNKIRNDYAVSSNKPESNASSSSAQTIIDSPSMETSVNVIEGVDTDKPVCKVSETNMPWINQNLPTAAISPLSKQVAPRSASTGAVRKKPKLQSAYFWDTVSSSQTCSSSSSSTFNPRENESAWDNFNTGTIQPIRENHPEFPRNVVENIILDLQSALPFGQMKEDSSDSFWSSINAYIISRIRAHMNVPLPHKSLASLRQSLDHLTSEMKFCYNEGDFLKYISQLLFESLTCFMATGRFTSSPPFTALPDGSSVQESAEKSLDLSLPIETDDKTKELSINMPADDVFLPQFQTVLQQNILSTVEAEDDVGIIQPVCTAPSEEEIGCKWGPEAEAEPEVEASTEADLAEADQSPGQGNITSTSLSVVDSWSTPIDQSTSVLRNVPVPNNTGIVLNVIEGSDSIDNSEVTMGAHCCPDQEISLDDIPTKLSTTEEEPQKLEEQSSQLSSDNTTKEKCEAYPESNSN